jgi:hypothetical protein
MLVGCEHVDKLYKVNGDSGREKSSSKGVYKTVSLQNACRLVNPYMGEPARSHPSKSMTEPQTQK